MPTFRNERSFRLRSKINANNLILENTLACISENYYSETPIPIIAEKFGVGASNIIHLCFQSTEALNNELFIEAIRTRAMKYLKAYTNISLTYRPITLLAKLQLAHHQKLSAERIEQAAYACRAAVRHI